MEYIKIIVIIPPSHVGFWEVVDWWIVCWWSHLQRGPSAKQNYFVSTFYSCSIPGSLILDSWILRSVHITPFYPQWPPLVAPQSWDNHCDTNSFKPKLHLHTPGLVTLHMQVRLIFSSCQYLTSDSFMLSRAQLHCGAMQGNPTSPSHCSCLAAQYRHEKGVYFTAAALLKKSC